MNLISDHYRSQNLFLHETKPGFGVAGYRHAFKVGRICEDHNLTTILDYGCGKATLKPELKRTYPRATVQNYDPVTFPIKPRRADLLVSTDVLEHIEPEFLVDVLVHMASLGKWAYLTISTRPAQKTLPDGRNAHLIQENQAWWKARILKHWEIEQWNVSQEEIETCLRSTLVGTR